MSYALRIAYNGRGPFTTSTPERAELLAVLSSSERGDSLHLRVKNGDVEHELDPVVLGDTLRIEYARSADPETIATLAADASQPQPLTPGHRLALELLEVPSPWQRFVGILLSHPEGGGVSLVLGTIPRDHARVFASASNELESWHWQLPDLYDGDAIAFRVVETSEGDTYPEMKAVDPEDDATGLAICARYGAAGTPHVVEHRLYFSSERAALDANDKLLAAGFQTAKPRGGGGTWSLEFAHRPVPTEAAMAEARALIRSLAGDAKYDGWQASPEDAGD